MRTALKTPRSVHLGLSILTLLLAAAASWGVELGDFSSENGYYLIQSANDLKKLATYVNNGGETSGKKFKLTANITLSSNENFTPIGTRKSFSGTFEGNNKTISGLSATCYAEGYNATYCGLFGSNYGTIQNINLKNVHISGSGTYVYKGGIAGYSYGTISDCTVENITITGSRAGGIVGENDGTVSRCKVTKATINSASSASSYTSIGGIAGGQGSGAGGTNLITKCEVRSSKLYGEGYVGGIIGYSSNATRVSSSLVASSEVYGTYDYGVVASGATQSLNYYYKTSLNGTMNSNTVKMTFNHSSSNHCKATPYSVLGMTYENDGYYTSGANIQFTFEVDQPGYGCKYKLASSNPVLYGSGDKVSITINKDTTVTVSDSVFRYSITYVLDNKGTNPANIATSYTADNSITLPTPTPSEEGYVFAGWFESSSFTDDPVTTIPMGSTGNKKFYALWQKDIAVHPDITYEPIPDQVWTGNLLQPAITIKDTTANITRYMGDPFYSDSEVGEASVRLYPPKRINGAMNKYCGRLELRFNIVKATPTVVAPVANELEYNERFQTLVTEGSSTIGKLKYSLDGISYSTSRPTAKLPGQYTVYYKVEETDNYSGVTGSVTVYIEQVRAILNRPVAASLVYNGLPQNLLSKKGSYSLTLVNTHRFEMQYTVCPTASYSSSTCTPYSTEIPTAITAGKYYVRYMMATDSVDFYYGEGGSVEVTIGKAETEIQTKPSPKTLTYTGYAQILATSGTTDKPKLCDLVYSLDNVNFTAGVPTAVNAGDYTVYYKLPEKNCTGAEGGSIQVTVEKAKISMPKKFGGTYSTYDGQPHVLLTDYETSVPIYYSLDTENFSETIPTAVNAGNYAVYYKVADDNYFIDPNGVYYIDDTQTILMTMAIIEQATPIMTKDPVANKLTFNGKPQELVTAGEANFPIYYSLDDKNYSTSIPTAKNCGKYTVYYKVGDKENFTKVLQGGVSIGIAGTLLLSSAYIDINEVKGPVTIAALDGDYTGSDIPKITTNIPVDSIIFDRKFPITAGKNYSTLTLPFDVTLDQLTGVSNIYEFTGMGKNNNTGALQFEIANTDQILAYKPHIIQMSDEMLKIKRSKYGYTIKKIPSASYTTITSGTWNLVGTIAYKKWEKDNLNKGKATGTNADEIGYVYGFSAYPFVSKTGIRYNAGEFIKFSSGSFIKPMRAYLINKGKTMTNAPIAKGEEDAIAATDEELPDRIDVVIVDRRGEEEHTTVIGSLDTRTGEIHFNSNSSRTFDLKGRNVGKPKAKGMYLKK